MKTQLTTQWLLLITLILLSTAGCNLLAGGDPASVSGGNIETQVAGTMIAMHVAETMNAQGAEPGQAALPAATNTQAQLPEMTITSSPTVTLTPTITLTATLEVPMVSVSRNTYCRVGPGEGYADVGALLEGEQAEVVGQSDDGQFWIIKNPDGEGECWLWAYYATVTGPTDGLTNYAPPPTPTPEFDWSGAWSVSMGSPCGGDPDFYTLNAAVDGNVFAATIDTGGSTITYTGTISEDYMTVSGTWDELGIESGSFKFYAVGVSQFNGNFQRTDMYAMCGARGGAGYPDPCYVP